MQRVSTAEKTWYLASHFSEILRPQKSRRPASFPALRRCGDQFATRSSHDCMSMTMSDDDNTDLAGECRHTMRLLDMLRRTHYELVQVQGLFCLERESISLYIIFFSINMTDRKRNNFFNVRKIKVMIRKRKSD